ncbi:MAG: hypothetical protein ACI4NE_01545 [Succinivibrio sp.]
MFIDKGTNPELEKTRRTLIYGAVVYLFLLSGYLSFHFSFANLTVDIPRIVALFVLIHFVRTVKTAFYRLGSISGDTRLKTAYESGTTVLIAYSIIISMLVFNVPSYAYVITVAYQIAYAVNYIYFIYYALMAVSLLSEFIKKDQQS